MDNSNLILAPVTLLLDLEDTTVAITVSDHMQTVPTPLKEESK